MDYLNPIIYQIYYHILGQPLIQSKRERKNRRTSVPGLHFEFFVPDFGQNFEKKSGNAHPSKKTVLSVKQEFNNLTVCHSHSIRQTFYLVWFPRLSAPTFGRTSLGFVSYRRRYFPLAPFGIKEEMI